MQAEYQLRMLAKTRLEQRDRLIEAQYDSEHRLSAQLEHPSHNQGSYCEDKVDTQTTECKNQLRNEKYRTTELEDKISLDLCDGDRDVASERTNCTNWTYGQDLRPVLTASTNGPD